MAARYWVGGTGNWSDATNHWSDSSGGTPNASYLPTSADDVYFDNNSHTTNFTVTLNQNSDCKDLNFSGLTTRICTFANLSNNKTLSIYGSFYINSYVTGNWAGTGTINFKSTTTEEILNMNSTFYVSRYFFDGVGGKWVLLSDFYSTTGQINLTNGELDLAGYIFTANSFYTQSGTKTLTLGGGTFSLYNWYNSNSSNFTFNNTGTIEIRCGAATISGATSFYNLKITSVSTDGWKTCDIGANLTVTNLFTVDGLSNKRRLLIQSNSATVRRTITSEVNSIQFCDFMDITGAGSADWDLSAISTGIGNAGNNSGIIFAAPKTCYFYGSSGDWTTLSNWFSATGGGGTANYYPLVQDNVIFDENSLFGDTEITYDSTSTCTDFICTDIIYDLVFFTGTSNNFRFMVWGSIYFNPNVSFPDTFCSFTFFSRSNAYIEAENIDIKTINLYNYNGIVFFLSNINITGGLYFRANMQGSLDLNGFDLTIGSSLQHYGKDLYLRDGVVTININSGYALFISGGVVYPGTSTIKVNPTSGSGNVTIITFGGTKNLYNLELTGTHTGWHEIICNSATGVLNMNQLRIDAGRKLRLSEYGTVKVNEVVANGTESNIITITSNASAQHKFVNKSTNDITVTYCNISWSSVSGTLRIKTILNKTWSAMSKTMGVAKTSIKKIMGIYVNSAWIATNSTDSGNNSGWNFTP